MAEADLQQFLGKVAQLNALVTLTEQRPELRQALSDCRHHQEVVQLAKSWGFEIGRRWGESEGNAPTADNLLGSTCPPPGTERSTILVETAGLRLETIHSCQASSPEGFWYDQAQWEWTCLLQGSARLQMEDCSEPLDLNRGDVLLISPHRRHRLIQTDPHPGTIWLNLFWSDPGV